MKNTLAFSLLAALLLIFTWVSASEDISRDLSDGIVRLHILANSDTAEDQALKLKVRDRLLTEAKKSSKPLTDSEIQKVCEAEIKENGYSYTAKIERGRFYFPQKNYENLTLPAGDYNAVRIVIGEGNGQNWWCVMYPPLCFTGETTANFDKETVDLITKSGSPQFKIKFKILELLN